MALNQFDRDMLMYIIVYSTYVYTYVYLILYTVIYIYIYIYVCVFVNNCICAYIYIHIFKLDVQECGKMYIHVHRSLKGMEIDDFAHEAPGSFIGIPGFGEVPNLDTGMAGGSCKGVGQPDVRSVRRAILCSKCWPGIPWKGLYNCFL